MPSSVHATPADPIHVQPGVENPTPQPTDALLKRSRITLRRFAGPMAYVGKLDNIRVAHLTDLHVGRVTPLQVQLDAARIANELFPDLVLITGDFVCHSQKYLDELTTVINTFKAPVICVLGNHDHWCGAQEVRQAIIRGGAEILTNQNTIITLKNQRIQVAGIDDGYTSHSDRDKATKGLRKDIPIIGLSHIPEEADGLWAKGVPFVLSGHTHAGQITLASLHELSLGKIGGHKYVHGLYGSRRVIPQDDSLTQGAVYVGAGIGAGVMPVRIGERGMREVTLFELGTEPASFDEHHDDQPALPGRQPSPRTMWKRAQAVILKEQKRERQRAKQK